MSAETNKEGGWRGGKKKKMWLKIRKVTDEERKLWNAHGRKREWGKEKKKLKKRMIMCVPKRGNGGLFEKSVSMKERIKRKNDQEGKMWERKESLSSHLPLPQLHPHRHRSPPGERCEFNLDRSSCQSHHWHIGTDKHFTPLENIHRTWPWDWREAAL